MPAITPQDVADLVQSILPDLDPMNWEQIAQTLQDYVLMSHWLRDDKVTFEGGIAVRKNLLATTSGAASHTGMTDTDDVDIPSVMDDIIVPWRHAQTKWAYHYQTDILMNVGKAKINDTVKPRRQAAMIDLALELEGKAWQVPSVNDKLNPYGLPYWVVANATTGFNGGYPTGPDSVQWTNIAGLDLTQTPNFRNYTAQYTAVSKDDLLPKMRTALRATNFRSPISKEEMSTPRGRDRRYYCNESVCSAFEQIGEAQNENLGRDLAPMTAGAGFGGVQDVDGTLTFKKNPIVWAPALDDTTIFPTSIANAPVYQIDHAVFFPFCLKGDYLRETGPVAAPNQHNMYRCFIDLTYNFVCTNRRRLAVFSR
jgi:hypothetical protein